MPNIRKYTDRLKVSPHGQLILSRRLVDSIAANLADMEVDVTIEVVSERRSPNQNAYYWAAIVGPITERFNDLGERFFESDVHEILKYKFLKVTVFDEGTGEVMVEYVRSTSNLKMYEMCFYIDDCIRYASTDLEMRIESPTKRRTDYIFPIFAKEKEPRQKYVDRIRSYLDDIYHVEHLRRFFDQNDEWASDVEIKALFTERKESIYRLRG